MITDIWTVLWKEWRELLRLGGGRRGTIMRAVFSVGLLGVIWPWLIGPSFVSSGLPVIVAVATSAMYVSALVPDTFPGERERHTLETLLASRLPDSAILIGKLGATIAYGYIASIAILFTGWATVNLKVGAPPFLLYNRYVLLSAVVFSALGAGFIAAIGALVSLRAATVKQAQQVLTTGVMLLVLAPAILAEAWPRGWEWLVARFSGQSPGRPGQAITVALGLLLVQGVIFAVVAGRFRRSRLLIEGR